MTDYISRKAVIEKSFCAGLYDTNEVLYGSAEVVLADEIRSIPAADVRPVVRGKWIERRFSEDVYGAECSVCHTTWDYGTNYCPNCGADMRGEQDEKA